MSAVTEAIKYEADIDTRFAQEILATPGGESLDACIQCGTCSGVCPLSQSMDYTPRRIIGLTRAGFKKEVLKSRTIWICSSCYACTVECPREIKVTDIMYALKRMAIEEGTYPRGLAAPVLAQEFFKMVKAKGRTNELWVAFWMTLKTGFWKLLGMTGLGINLLRTGRLALGTARIEGQPQLAGLLECETAKKEGGAR
jgi:quinone-modifying oxidoreductase, subunit QmoC